MGIRDVKFATTLKRLTLSQVPLQVNHLRKIIIFAVMINTSFTFGPEKYVRNNIQEKRSIDLDYDGITIKKAIGNS